MCSKEQEIVPLVKKSPQSQVGLGTCLSDKKCQCVKPDDLN